MPRLVDYGALWPWDKIARCAEWAPGGILLAVRLDGCLRLL